MWQVNVLYCILSLYVLIDFLYMWYDAALNIEIEHFCCCFLKTTAKWIICMFLNNGWNFGYFWLLLALKWLQLFLSGKNVGDKCKKTQRRPWHTLIILISYLTAQQFSDLISPTCISFVCHYFNLYYWFPPCLIPTDALFASFLNHPSPSFSSWGYNISIPLFL